MKYRILIAIIVLMSLFSLTVNAANYEYSISLDDTFISAKHNDDLTQITKKLNTTPETLSKHFEQNGIIYLAISEDTKSQINISVDTNDFSKKVSDISMLDDNAVSEFAKSFNVSEEAIVVNNDRKFVSIKSTDEYSDGIYTTTSYVTICDNKIFYFTGYNIGEDTSPQITAAFDTFELNKTSVSTLGLNLSITIVIAGIILFCIVSVAMIIGIIKLKGTRE